jgi:hypothetical protein
MSITANSGPYVSFGQGPYPDYNPEAGPSLAFAGWGLLDPRSPFTYKPGQDFGAVNAGFVSSPFMTLNITPAAIGVGAVAAAANPVSGTPMVLVSSSGAGIVVGASVVNASTGVLVTGLLAVGQATGRVGFGTAGTIQPWDPTTLTARALSITAAASATGGAFVVRGYDVYGYPMSESITSVANSTVSGKKAFKYIASVTPGVTDGSHLYSVDTTDVFGFPLASQYFGDLMVNYPATVITANTGYLAAVVTAPSATTGDVRGTYALQSASNGTNRLIVYQTPLLANLALANGPSGGPATGLFGPQQFTS